MNAVTKDKLACGNHGDAYARLRWAWNRDRLIHASIAVGNRTPTYGCPYCEHKVVPVGRTRTTFFRHAKVNPGCWTHGAEGLAHHKTKESLAAALRAAAGTTVSVAFGCDCTTPHDGPTWTLPPWDEVEVERDLGGAVADIALLRAGELVAVIEIYCSSTVSLKKAGRLDELAVPWIEIPVVVSEAGPEPGRRRRRVVYGIVWDLRQPLRARRSGPAPRGCPVCEAARAATARPGGKHRPPVGSNPLVLAAQQGRLEPLWRREFWQVVDGRMHTLCTLEICDVFDADGNAQRCLCLANHRHVVTWSGAEPGAWDIDRVRDDFREAQRFFIRVVRTMTQPRIDPWVPV